MEDSEEDVYTHADRAFVQALMSRGALTFKDAKPIIAAILTAKNNCTREFRPDQIDEAQFNFFLRSASNAVSPFDYEIRSTIHQTTKTRVHAVVNTTSDPQTQMATTHNPDELAFIKRLLDAMFDLYNSPRMEIMAITQMQAIKLARPPPRQQDQTQADDDEDEARQATTDKGLKHSEVEDVMANLVNGGWLEKSRRKFYSLTPRALLELRPWLTETYNDPDAEPNEWQPIKTCEACKDLLTVGLRCAEPDCNFRLHDMCQDAFWRARGTEKCPKCSKTWTGDKYVGERAVTHTEAYERGRRRSGAGASNRNRRSEVTQQEPVEEEEEEEEESDN